MRCPASTQHGFVLTPEAAQLTSMFYGPRGPLIKTHENLSNTHRNENDLKKSVSEMGFYKISDFFKSGKFI